MSGQNCYHFNVRGNRLLNLPQWLLIFFAVWIPAFAGMTALTAAIEVMTVSDAAAQSTPAEITVPGGTVPQEEAYPVIFEATRKAVLSAEIAGALRSIDVDMGSRVKKGAVVARVDPGDLDLKKKRSELALKHLNVKVDNLERLNQRGLATNEELEQVRMERDVTYTDIEIFKRQIAKTAIYAPFDCVVVRRRVQPHEWVTAGQPVVEVVDTSELQAVANIPSRLAVKLERKSIHTFYVHDLNITVTGTVQSVVPEVDELSNTAQVIWKIEKPNKELLSGMKGEVRIGS